MRNEKGQKTDRIKKNVIKIFKKIGFKNEIQIKLKTFNLSNGTHKPYWKPNNNLLHVNTFSNHPPQIIKQIPTSTAERLSKNPSSVEIFNSAKVEYENALENSGYHSIKLNYTQTARENKRKHKRNRKIICFNPQYRQNVITNVEKHVLNVLDVHFPKSIKLHKIFKKYSES